MKGGIYMSNKELISLITNPRTWEYDYCAEACKRAGLTDAFEKADDEHRGAVVEQAIQILK